MRRSFFVATMICTALLTYSVRARERDPRTELVLAIMRQVLAHSLAAPALERPKVEKGRAED